MVSHLYNINIEYDGNILMISLLARLQILLSPWSMIMDNHFDNCKVFGVIFVCVVLGCSIKSSMSNNFIHLSMG